MDANRHLPKPSILTTVDTFIAAVPWGEFRTVLVFRRVHGGRKYVRIRTWNHNRAMRVWYPTKRFFVMPIQNAEPLAAAMVTAGRGDAGQKPPAWLTEREERDLERYHEALDSDSPEWFLNRLRRNITHLLQERI